MARRFSSQYLNNRKKIRLVLWALLLGLVFMLALFFVAWIISPNSDAQIRRILNIAPSSTPTPIPTTAPPPTSTPTITPTPSPEPKVICIDAGRGGEEKTPVTNKAGNVFEKTVNLDFSLLLREKLESLGYKVVMTRTEDNSVSQKDRVSVSNNADADLFISIHMNNLPSNATVNGLEILYGKNRTDSKELADTLINPVVKCGAKNRGTKVSSSYTVLNDVTCPSVIIMLGFISNDDELAKIQSDEYRQAMIDGICKGLENYFAYYGKKRNNN